MEFSVFCIESIAEKLGIKGDEVYKILTQKSQLLNGYIIPYYDVLHTQSKDYVINDIMECLRAEGVL